MRRKRPNLGRGQRSAVERVVRRRNRRQRGEPEEIPIHRDIEAPIGRFIRNLPISDPYRYGDYIHVSDLVYKCLRMVALAQDMKIPVPTEPNWHSMKLIHQMGIYAHSWVKKQVISRTNKVFGNWKCKCGHTEFGPCIYQEARRHECPVCRHSLTEYDELHLDNDEYMIVGNCDLAVMDGRYLVLSELKGISRTQFDDLEDAKPDHKIQILLYAWLAREAGFLVHPNLSVFYVCREWGYGNPYKEFIVTTDDLDRRISPMLYEAQSMIEFNEHGVIPDNLLCDSPDHARAKKCAMCTECFAR